MQCDEQKLCLQSVQWYRHTDAPNPTAQMAQLFSLFASAPSPAGAMRLASLRCNLEDPPILAIAHRKPTV
ncbi:MAG: hypothetical protein ACPIOQ_39115, partial [Promethearchaeia archaeon]